MKLRIRLFPHGLSCLQRLAFSHRNQKWVLRGHLSIPLLDAVTLQLSVFGKISCFSRTI